MDEYSITFFVKKYFIEGYQCLHEFLCLCQKRQFKHNVTREDMDEYSIRKNK